MNDYPPIEHVDSLTLIHQIVDAEPGQRKRMINDFLESRTPVFNRLSYTIARKFAAENSRDDIRQIVMIEAHEMITEAINATAKFETIHSFEGMLQARSHARSRTYLERNNGGITEISSILRRRRMLMATLEEMNAVAGHEVSDQEVVDAHNAKVTASRVNAQKQGMIATVRDIRQTFTTASDVELAELPTGEDTSSSIQPLESRQMMEETILRCDAADPALGVFARAWFERVYFDGNMKPDQVLAKEFSISRLAVASYICQIQEIAQDVLKFWFDLKASDREPERVSPL